MPTPHTFATLCARLNRAPIYIREVPDEVPIQFNQPASGGSLC